MDNLAVDLSTLPKKERKRLKREMEREEKEKKSNMAKIVKWSIVGIAVLLALLGGWWGYKELSKPLPGQSVANLGREHVKKEEWEKFAYNSNPPTSGPHDATWTKAGIYDQPQPEGMLIHALEHGYIVLNYNCNLESENFKAQSKKLGTESGQKKEESTSSGEATVSGTLPAALSEQECNTLKKQLSDLANGKKLFKLIVVPRPNLDTQIALTAWTWIDKMEQFDKERIGAFIDAHRNHGPEQTME